MRNNPRRWFGPRTVDLTARRRRRREPLSPDVGGQHLAGRAKNTDLVLHIGLHKTASSYIQGVLGASRDNLLREGVLYPTTGIVDKGSTSTREGAGSGQGLLSRRGRHRVLLARLMAELEEDIPTVLISSEEFSRGGDTPSPAKLLDRFKAFRSVKVVLVLRRQDDWIESFYKQSVDQYGNFETRSFDEFLEQVGSPLLDFHTRFTPWRDLVGPENFHVLSYDDLPDGAAICRRLLEIAGLQGPVLDELGKVSVPRYDSVRAIDTVGLRILNSHRLEDRDIRTRTARSIYDAAPAGDIELMSPAAREKIQAMCDPINQRIETEWFGEPVPGFRFGTAPRASDTNPPSGLEMVDYIDQVISLCEEGRSAAMAETMWGVEGE
jgi:hypothetical protein